MRRLLTILAMTLAGSTTSAADKVNLTESFAVKDCTRVEIRTKVDGERIFFQEGSKKTQPVKLEAGHRCAEKVLAQNATGQPTKLARNYDAARSTLIIGSEKPTVQTLRVDRALLVALRSEDTLVVFSPKGPLSREELELVGEHFDTMAVGGLLPGKEMTVGGTWPIANGTALALCQFEALEQHSLTARLEEIGASDAKVSISGTAKGIEGGAPVTLSITASLTFDSTKQKIVALDWKQEDQREQGPLSPGFKATVTISVRRSLIDEPAELNDAALVGVPNGSEVPAGMTAITYRDPTGRFELTHPREWRLTSATDMHTTMRLVERGDLVAQANITMMDRAKPGQHMEPAEFKEKMMSSPGWQPGEVVEEAEVKGRPDRFMFRLSAGGTIDDKQIVQTFYLVACANGEQAVIAFQTEPQKANKLAGRDLVLVEGIELTPKH